jgi:hypothetical protein
MSSMQEFWVAFLLMLAIAYVIAWTRKGTVKMSMSASPRELHSPADPATVAERIRHLGKPYTVDDDSGTVICLSSPVTFMSWGFFYPVHIHPEGTGSKIVVGVRSKIFQVGPIPARAHAKCVEAIEQALSVPAARIA